MDNEKRKSDYYVVTEPFLDRETNKIFSKDAVIYRTVERGNYLIAKKKVKLRESNPVPEVAEEKPEPIKWVKPTPDKPDKGKSDEK